MQPSLCKSTLKTSNTVYHCCFQDNTYYDIPQVFIDRYPGSYISKLIKNKTSYTSNNDLYYIDFPSTNLDLIIKVLCSKSIDSINFDKNQIALGCLSSSLFFSKPPKIVFDMLQMCYSSLFDLCLDFEISIYSIEQDSDNYGDDFKKINKYEELSSDSCYCLVYDNIVDDKLAGIIEKNKGLMNCVNICVFESSFDEYQNYTFGQLCNPVLLSTFNQLHYYSLIYKKRYNTYQSILSFRCEIENSTKNNKMKLKWIPKTVIFQDNYDYDFFNYIFSNIKYDELQSIEFNFYNNSSTLGLLIHNFFQHSYESLTRFSFNNNILNYITFHEDVIKDLYFPSVTSIDFLLNEQSVIIFTKLIIKTIFPQLNTITIHSSGMQRFDILLLPLLDQLHTNYPNIESINIPDIFQNTVSYANVSTFEYFINERIIHYSVDINSYALNSIEDVNFLIKVINNNSNLEFTLDLSLSHLTDENIVLLFQSINKEVLENIMLLNISNNPITSKGFSFFIEFLSTHSFQSLQTLYMTNLDNITRRGFQKTFEILHTKDIHDNKQTTNIKEKHNLKDTIVSTNLSSEIHYPEQLESVILDSNNLTDIGCISFMKTWKHPLFKTCKCFYLQNTNITAKSLLFSDKCFSHSNNQIKDIYVNGVTDEDQSIFEEKHNQDTPINYWFGYCTP